MNEERNPELESLFAENQQDLADDSFTQSVVARVTTRRRRVLAGRVTVVVLLIALELLLESPIQSSLGVFSGILGTTLIQIDNEWLDFDLAPLNSPAGLLGMVLLALHYVYRRPIH